ncbi:MAG: hypothetical protein AAF846_17300 [Chloroflexota bacterium]
MAEKILTRITAEEYFQLPEYAERDLIELIDGEVIIRMPPVLKHQRLVRAILLMLTQIAEELGGEAIPAPFEVKLDDKMYLNPIFSTLQKTHNVL